MCDPSDRLEILKEAWPDPFKATFAARVVAPSLKVTVPAVTGVPSLCLVTVAVNVTVLFGVVVKEGLGVEFNVVTVATAEGAVVISRVHPPVMLAVCGLLRLSSTA